jgi:acetyltransferase-like isoleucine patch superfamily enzyme
MKAFRSIADDVYRSLRQTPAGLDPDLSTRDLFRFAWRRACQASRGTVRGLPGAFLGSGVRLRGRQHLVVGRSVSLGDSVVIEAVSHDGVTLGDSVTVDSCALIRASGVLRNLGRGVSVGPRTSIGAFNVLLGSGGLTIGADCLLGPYVTIVTENHRFQEGEVPIRLQGEERRPVVIGNDVWIGAGATILAGSHVEDGAIVAAGAVVSGHVSAQVIVGGIPARPLRRRS